MKIFIMRHGEAEVVSSSDEARHLTDYGRKQSILQGQWLKKPSKIQPHFQFRK